MNKTMKVLAAAALAGCMCSSTEMKASEVYPVIPLPQEAVMTDGSFVIDDDISVFYPKGNAAMERNARFLSGYLEKYTGKKVRVKAGKGGKGSISLRLDPTVKDAEGYAMRVDADGVVVSGAGEAGVFYGIQTLRKALSVDGKGVASLPCSEIKDSPRFGYRGVHFDVSRHFFTVDEVKSFIDMMALHNMNRLHWHISDDQGWRIEIKKYPGLTEVGSRRKETVIGHNSGSFDGTPYGGFYTQEEAREIVDYAAKRYITVIPEIDLPGHMQAALAAYPHLGCTGGPYDVWTMWGVSDNVLCAGNDEVLTFIDDVLTEIMDIFPSEYVHIGGDECPKTQWEKCPRCQARIKELGFTTDADHSKEEYLQSYIISHGEKLLNAHGRKMIGWDEILEGGLAPNATVMSWRGETGGIKAAKMRHDVIMVPNTYLYFDYYQTNDTDNEPLAIGGYVPLERVYGYEPLPESLSAEEQKHIIGLQANHWTEYIPTLSHLQYMALPRWAALSEIQWSRPEQKDYAGFLGRLRRLMRLYDAEGYNYARHVFDVSADFRPDAATGTLEVGLRTLDGVPVRYTLDGTEPSENSPVAPETLHVKSDCTLKAKAIRPDRSSRTFSEKIAFGKSTCRPVVANQPVNRQYEFKGVSTLTDGLKGNSNYKTGRWIGFYGNDMDITLDLGESQEVAGVDFTACVNKGDWIFDVRGITVEVSEDGKTFTKVFSEEYPAMKETDRNGLYEHNPSFTPAKARYVRVVAASERSIPEWHGGKGSPGFLFVDEVSVR